MTTMGPAPQPMQALQPPPAQAPSYTPEPTIQALPPLLSKAELQALLRGGNLPNFANASTGVYGISGSGKSSLVDTAIAFTADIFGVTSHVNVTDLGGFGTRRLSLIRLGLTSVYDPRNRQNPIETMELLSRGAMPAYYDDPETGKAPPDVPLIEPRQVVSIMRCMNGHEVARGPQYQVVQTHVACSQCGVVTSAQNATVKQVLVRPALFATVGHWAFDSITEMNDWGMQRLGFMSATNLLPKNASGGSLLGGANALEEGSVSYGGGSPAQVGFMQNRTHQWLGNIRAIPGQVIPATLTFAVEGGKADDDSGGVPVLGPQICGKARTATVPRWLGACLHATREPDAAGNMRYRLWLVNHLDPRDPRRIPYLAKHRGIPAQMPEFLEDPWFENPEQMKEAANSICSLDTFYRLTIRQLAMVEALDARRLGEAGERVRALRAAAHDEIIGEVSAPAPVVIPGQPGLGMPMPVVVRPMEAPPVMGVGPSQYVAALTAEQMTPVAGNQTISVPAAAFGMPTVPDYAAQAAKPVVQQLQESIAAATFAPLPMVQPPPPAMPLPSGLRTPGTGGLRVPGQVPPSPQPQAPVAFAPQPSVQPAPGPTARRSPRPPI